MFKVIVLAATLNAVTPTPFEELQTATLLRQPAGTTVTLPPERRRAFETAVVWHADRCGWLSPHEWREPRFDRSRWVSVALPFGETWVSWREDYDGAQDAFDFLRERRVEVESLPPLADVYRFPPDDAITAAYNNHNVWLERIESRLRWERDREPQLTAALRELEDRRGVLVAAGYLHYRHADDLLKRRKLAELKKWLPADDYRDGVLPTAIPLWIRGRSE